MNRKGYALKFAKHGWPVFPLKNKIPKLKGNWQGHATTDAETIQSWGDDVNYGLDLGGAGLVVVDVDNSEGKNGTQIWSAWLEDNDHVLPDTFTVASARGGFHYYFKGRTRNGVLMQDVDLKSDGGYVVAAGSFIAEGTYKIINKKAPVDLPDWLEKLIGERTERAENAQSAVIEVDQVVNIAQARYYLEYSAPQASRGEQGDQLTYNVACAVRGLGISEATCLDLLLDTWNENNTPPWPPELLETKVANAYTYALNPIGHDTQEARNLDAASKFADYGLPEDAKYDGPVDWNDLEGEAAEVDWAIENWLIADRGLTLFTGLGGSGKSSIALQLARAVASGTEWLGLPVLKKMPALVVSCEDPKVVLHRRKNGIENLRKLAGKEAEIERNMLVLWPRVGQPNQIGVTINNVVVKGPFYKILCDQIDKMPEGQRLIVLDTAADIFAGNENDRTSVSSFVKEILGSLTVERNCSLVVLAHPPKSGAQYSGSTAWQGSFRAMWHLTEAKDCGDQVKTLTVVKSNYGPVGDQFHLTWQSGCYNSVDVEEIADGIKTGILVYIETAASEGDPYGATTRSSKCIQSISVTDPMTGAIVPEEQITKCVKEMIRDGEVISGTKNGARGLFPA